MGGTLWFRIHREVEYFGAKVGFLPNPTNVLNVEKQGWHSPTWIDGVFVYWPLEAGEWQNKCVVIPEEDLVAVDPYSGKDLDACRLVTVTDIEIIVDDDGSAHLPHV